MEFFAERFEQAGVAEPGQLGLVAHGGRHWRIRSGDVFGGERVHVERGRLVGLERGPGGVVELAGHRQLAQFLEAGDSAAQVAAHRAVDFAGRKMGAVEQHLGAQDIVDDRRRHRGTHSGLGSRGSSSGGDGSTGVDGDQQEQCRNQGFQIELGA